MGDSQETDFLKTVKINAAEGDIFCLLVPSVSKPPKTQNPTFSMQASVRLDPHWLVNTSFKPHKPVCKTGFLAKKPGIHESKVSQTGQRYYKGKKGICAHIQHNTFIFSLV